MELCCYCYWWGESLHKRLNGKFFGRIVKQSMYTKPVQCVCVCALITSNERIGWRKKTCVCAHIQTKDHDNNYAKSQKTRMNCVCVFKFFSCRYGLCISIRCWFRSKCVLCVDFTEQNMNEWRKNMAHCYVRLPRFIFISIQWNTFCVRHRDGESERKVSH